MNNQVNQSAIQFPEFRNYIISRFFFIISLTMQATLVSWKVYDITKDPFSIGLIGIIEFVPAFIMAFYSGYIIDKSDKRTLLLLSISGNLACTALLCFITGTFFIDRFSKSTVLLFIYSCIFTIGVLRAFSGPTSFALVTQLIPRSLITNATTWHTGVWQVAAVLGPALGGILYGSIGITYSFFAMMVFLVIAAGGIVFIQHKPPYKTLREEKVLESLRTGFRFVYRSKEVLGALTLDMFAVLFGGATALLPVFADKILHVGPQGLGMLRSVPALGSVVMLVFFTFRPLKQKQGKTMLLSVVGFGICMIVFGFSKVFWLSMLALFISGMFDSISVIIRQTILQLKTPDEMRGRVAALNSIFIMSSNELGAFESGFTAKLMGTVAAVVFGGFMSLGVVVATWFKSPALRKMEY